MKSEIEVAQEESDDALAELERLVAELEEHCDGLSAAEADRDESWHYAIVRFHLGRGENYQKWQVSENGEVRYYDPDGTTLRMTNCRLRNRQGTAQRIFSGDNKTVCAWVACDTVEADPRPSQAPEGWSRVSYNPRVAPNWIAGGRNCDGEQVPELVSAGRGLYGNIGEAA